MIYWLTRTAGTSACVGYAHPSSVKSQPVTEVPTGVIMFAYDVGIRRYAGGVDITSWADIDHGGHFAALEQPDTLVRHVREFFHDLRQH